MLALAAGNRAAGAGIPVELSEQITKPTVQFILSPSITFDRMTQPPSLILDYCNGASKIATASNYNLIASAAAMVSTIILTRLGTN